MKKNLFFMGIAAAAMLASCSNDETMDMPQSKTKAISFTNAFVNNGTRSIVDPSFKKETLGSFAVYGFTQNGQIFDNQLVESKDGGSTWTYTPQQFWVKDNQYAFAAIAPAKTTVTGEKLEGSSATDYKVGMTVSFTNNGETDLLHASANPVDANDNFMASPIPVSFNFYHQLAKVKFSFANNVGEPYNIEVTDVKITNAKKSGTLTINSEKQNAWSEVTDPSLELDFGAVGNSQDVAEAIEYNGEGETYYEKLMIPTESSESYNVTFTVKLLNGTVPMGTYNHTATISNVELELGYCYDFKATLTGDNIVVDPEDPDAQLKPIVFEVTNIESWNEGNQDQTVDIPSANE